MSTIAHHVFRRGMEAYSASEKPTQYELPTWGAAILALTVVGLSIVSAMIEYTYGYVVATLTMVESPTEVFQAIPIDNPNAPLDEKKDQKNVIEPELQLVKEQPITAKFRTTIQHLRARAGRLSRFRGISLFYITQVVTYRLAALFDALGVPMILNVVLASVLTARLSMAWTHIVMSEPSTKYWFQRLPSYKLFSKVAIPTAVLALSEQVTIILPTLFFVAMRLDQITPEKMAEMNRCQISMAVFRTLTLVVLGLFSAIAIVVPARVTLTRVQASLLSESEEPIVPFDRSFGGKFVPTALGGSGVVSMLDAWKTFNWSSRVRILKVYAKVLVMQTALLVLGAALVFAEMRAITGVMPSAMIAAMKTDGQESTPTQV